MTKKSFILTVVCAACGSLSCYSDYVAREFISIKTGKSTIFWGDSSKGKDAYILEYDKDANKYYFEKVEKNKPAAEKNIKNNKPAAETKIENNKPAAKKTVERATKNLDNIHTSTHSNNMPVSA